MIQPGVGARYVSQWGGVRQQGLALPIPERLHQETHKAVGLALNGGQQLPGKLQTDSELLVQLLQGQGGPPRRPWESPDTGLHQEQAEYQQAEPWKDKEGDKQSC